MLNSIPDETLHAAGTLRIFRITPFHLQVTLDHASAYFLQTSWFALTLARAWPPDKTWWIAPTLREELEVSQPCAFHVGLGRSWMLLWQCTARSLFLGIQVRLTRMLKLLGASAIRFQTKLTKWVYATLDKWPHPCLRSSLGVCIEKLDRHRKRKEQMEIPEMKATSWPILCTHYRRMLVAQKYRQKNLRILCQQKFGNSDIPRKTFSQRMGFVFCETTLFPIGFVFGLFNDLLRLIA